MIESAILCLFNVLAVPKVGLISVFIISFIAAMLIPIGWLKLPFWPWLAYIALGKILHYIAMIWLLLNVSDGFWRQVGQWLA